MKIVSKNVPNNISGSNSVQSIMPGDKVSGKIISSYKGHVQMCLPDGSTLNARLAEGVELDVGSSVRLLIGEKVDGVLSARLLESAGPYNSGSIASDGLGKEIANALAAFGESSNPALIDRVLRLVREGGSEVSQAAFLAANSLDKDTSSLEIFSRIVKGEFGFGTNWHALADRVADAVAKMPIEPRAELLAALRNSETISRFVSDLFNQALTSQAVKGGLSLSEAERGVLLKSSFQLKATLKEVIFQLLSKTEAFRSPIAYPSAEESALPIAIPKTEVFSANNVFPTLKSVNAAQAQNSSAEPAISSSEGFNRPTASGELLSTLQKALPPIPGGQLLTKLLLSKAAQAGPAIIDPAVLDAQPMPGNGQAMDQLSLLLSKLQESLRLNTEAAPTSAEARERVLAQFEQAVPIFGAERGNSNPLNPIANGQELDLSKLLSIVREQLEWTTAALSKMDPETAASIQPLIKDALVSMRLFTQITTYNTFVQLPLVLGSNKTSGELYIMKRRGKQGKIDASNFTLYISLETQNLGHIEVLAHAKNKQVTLSFSVDNDAIQSMLRTMRAELHEGLEKKGFRLVDLKVKISSENQVNPLTANRVVSSLISSNAAFDVKV